MAGLGRGESKRMHWSAKASDASSRMSPKSVRPWIIASVNNPIVSLPGQRRSCQTSAEIQPLAAEVLNRAGP